MQHLSKEEKLKKQLEKFQWQIRSTSQQTNREETNSTKLKEIKKDKIKIT